MIVTVLIIIVILTNDAEFGISSYRFMHPGRSDLALIFGVILE